MVECKGRDDVDDVVGRRLVSVFVDMVVDVDVGSFVKARGWIVVDGVVGCDVEPIYMDVLQKTNKTKTKKNPNIHKLLSY